MSLYLEISNHKINRILKFYEEIKEISKNDLTINEELKQLDLKRVQTILDSPNYAFWVIFGDGKFDYGEGEIENSDIVVKIKTPLFRQILEQKKSALTEFTKKNMQIQGDIQYAVVYFDFLNYSLDYIKDIRGESK